MGATSRRAREGRARGGFHGVLSVSFVIKEYEEIRGGGRGGGGARSKEAGERSTPSTAAANGEGRPPCGGAIAPRRGGRRRNGNERDGDGEGEGGEQTSSEGVKARLSGRIHVYADGEEGRGRASGKTTHPQPIRRPDCPWGGGGRRRLREDLGTPQTPPLPTHLARPRLNIGTRREEIDKRRGGQRPSFRAFLEAEHQDVRERLRYGSAEPLLRPRAASGDDDCTPPQPCDPGRHDALSAGSSPRIRASTDRSRARRHRATRSLPRQVVRGPRETAVECEAPVRPTPSPGRNPRPLRRPANPPRSATRITFAGLMSR